MILPQVDNQVVLPQLGGRAARLRHLQPRQLQAHPRLDDGGQAAHRAAQGRLHPRRLQAGSRRGRGPGKNHLVDTGFGKSYIRVA